MSRVSKGMTLFALGVDAEAEDLLQAQREIEGGIFGTDELGDVPSVVRVDGRNREGDGQPVDEGLAVTTGAGFKNDGLFALLSEHVAFAVPVARPVRFNGSEHFCSSRMFPCGVWGMTGLFPPY